MGTSRLQKIYVKGETIYGDADGAFSGGLRLWNAADGMVELSEIKQLLNEVNYTTGAMDENTPPADETYKTATFSLELHIPGATLSGDDVDADNFTTFMNLLCNTAGGAATSDACDAGCSTTSIIVAGASTYTVGDVIIINGEARLVDTWNFGTSTITVAVPFSAAPVAATKIYNAEQWTLSDKGSSMGFGFEHPGSPNYDLLCKGVFASNITPSGFSPGENIKLSLELTCQDFIRAAGAVTSAAIDEVSTKPVSSASGGVVATTDDADALINVCAMSAEIESGAENIPVQGFTAINGICGFAAAPKSDKGSLTIQIYEDGTPLREEFVDIVGKSRDVYVQMGTTRGNIVGFIFRDAHLKEEVPGFADQDGLFYIPTVWRTAPSIIMFRG